MPRHRHTFRPRLEPLEDRTLPDATPLGTVHMVNEGGLTLTGGNVWVSNNSFADVAGGGYAGRAGQELYALQAYLAKADPFYGDLSGFQYISNTVTAGDPIGGYAAFISREQVQQWELRWWNAGFDCRPGQLGTFGGDPRITPGVVTVNDINLLPGQHVIDPPPGESTADGSYHDRVWDPTYNRWLYFVVVVQSPTGGTTDEAVAANLIDCLTDPDGPSAPAWVNAAASGFSELMTNAVGGPSFVAPWGGLNLQIPDVPDPQGAPIAPPNAPGFPSSPPSPPPSPPVSSPPHAPRSGQLVTFAELVSEAERVWRDAATDNLPALLADAAVFRSELLAFAGQLLAAHPQLAVAPADGFNGYSPAQLRQAYGIPSSLTGSGQTIAIVDAYDDPAIQGDLAAFDSNYGLPTANLTVINQSGGTALPPPNAGWALEESLDVEMAHAMAPGAHLVLVEANSASLPDLMSAVSRASVTAGVSVVSLSWGSPEWAGETGYDSFFIPTNPTSGNHIVYVASAGDGSAQFGPSFPSSSASVLSVGGTSLHVNPDGSYAGESAWSLGGGGLSLYEVVPPWQAALGMPGRETPDVAFDADPTTGVSVYDSYGFGGFVVLGGTSVGAPAWAGLVALGDQQQVSAGKPTFSTASLEQSLYGAYASSVYGAVFHDVTSGNNGFPAGPGIDLATGLGTPQVANLLTWLGGGVPVVPPSPPVSPPPVSPPHPGQPPGSPIPIVGIDQIFSDEVALVRDLLGRNLAAAVGDWRGLAVDVFVFEAEHGI